MASGTADLQRDLGGALMTSIFAHSRRPATRTWARLSPISRSGRERHDAESAAAFRRERGETPRPPTRSTRTKTMAAAESSFLEGDQLALHRGTGGCRLRRRVRRISFFPGKEAEERLRLVFHEEDAAAGAGA